MNARRACLHSAPFVMNHTAVRVMLRSILLPALVIVATLGGGAEAFAQMLPETAPPEAGMVKTTAVWPGYVVMFVLGGVIVAISLMPSKRAHTD